MSATQIAQIRRPRSGTSAITARRSACVSPFAPWASCENDGYEHYSLSVAGGAPAPHHPCESHFPCLLQQHGERASAVLGWNNIPASHAPLLAVDDLTRSPRAAIHLALPRPSAAQA